MHYMRFPLENIDDVLVLQYDDERMLVSMNLGTKEERYGVSYFANNIAFVALITMLYPGYAQVCQGGMGIGEGGSYLRDGRASAVRRPARQDEPVSVHSAHNVAHWHHLRLEEAEETRR